MSRLHTMTIRLSWLCAQSYAVRSFRTEFGTLECGFKDLYFDFCDYVHSHIALICTHVRL